MRYRFPDESRSSGVDRLGVSADVPGGHGAVVCRASPAGAASDIEGVWAFNGGEIAVQPAANGTFIRTVVTETTFAQCVHPVGQQIWTDITPQPDGSYWGLHQWYPESATRWFRRVERRPSRSSKGPTAPTTYESALSRPGTSQPRIAPSGRQHRNDLGSAPVRRSALRCRPLDPRFGPTPVAPAIDTGTTPTGASRPSTSWYRCRATRNARGSRGLEIRITDPKDDAFKTVTVHAPGPQAQNEPGTDGRSLRPSAARLYPGTPSRSRSRPSPNPRPAPLGQPHLPTPASQDSGDEPGRRHHPLDPAVWSWRGASEGCALALP